MPCIILRKISNALLHLLRTLYKLSSKHSRHPRFQCRHLYLDHLYQTCFPTYGIQLVLPQDSSEELNQHCYLYSENETNIVNFRTHNNQFNHHKNAQEIVKIENIIGEPLTPLNIIPYYILYFDNFLENHPPLAKRTKLNVATNLEGLQQRLDFLDQNDMSCNNGLLCWIFTTRNDSLVYRHLPTCCFGLVVDVLLQLREDIHVDFH